MRAASRVALILAAGAALGADELSGPNHITIRRTPWGNFFYDPVATGPHQIEVTLDDFRIKSHLGEVRLLGSDLNGYRLVCGADVLTVRSTATDLDIRWQDKVWTWRSLNGTLTLTTSAPKDTLTFEWGIGTFTIKGTQGSLTVTSTPGTTSIRSSAGNLTITSYLQNRTFSGIGLAQLPYFGRAVYISFHGVGLMLDVVRTFPMPELSEWYDWRPILGPAYDPNAR
ncbi:MAG TPA: hypothetical protein VJ570_06410 [Holophagaceae bacterium]|nr:hypothetical protein [Holophagaceae bacterium]